MKQRPVPKGFIRGRYPPSLYLDFAEGFGNGQGALITGSSGTGGTATTGNGIVISDQQFVIALNALNVFNASEGTLFFEGLSFNGPQTGGFNRAVQIDDGTNNNNINIIRNSQLPRGFVTSGGVQQAGLTGATWGDAAYGKFALAWATNDIAGSFNGGNILSDTSATIPTGLTTLRIGHAAGGTGFWQGAARRIAYWPIRLSNNDLQNLTA